MGNGETGSSPAHVLVVVHSTRFFNGASHMAIGFLLMWVVFVLLVNYLARENKHRIGWTVAAGWFGILTLFVFLIVEGINHKRLEKLDEPAEKSLTANFDPKAVPGCYL